MKLDLRPAEREISRVKRELNQLFREDSLASREGASEEGYQRHLALLERELDNIRSIARYVEPISAPVSRDLSRWHAQLTSRFNDLRVSGSPASVQRWVVQELVPHLRRSEQAAHLVATSLRVGPKGKPQPFVWPVAAEVALNEAKRRGRKDDSRSPRKR